MHRKNLLIVDREEQGIRYAALICQRRIKHDPHQNGRAHIEIAVTKQKLMKKGVRQLLSSSR